MSIGSFLKKMFGFSEEVPYDKKKEAALEERLQRIDPDRKISAEAFMFAMEGVFEKKKAEGCSKMEADGFVESLQPPTRHLAKQALKRVYEKEELPPEEVEFRKLYNQIYGNSPWMKH